MTSSTSNNQCLHTAAVFHSSATQTTAARNSTGDEEEQRLYMPQLSHFKNCSLVLGLLVGFFIYLSTLGAEFVGVMLWGREILTKTNTELVAFSLVWNLVTTCIAIVILSSMRRLVSLVFLAAASRSRSQSNADDVLNELLSYMEGRFAVGALVGICLSWNVTNFLLGMKPQVIQSFIILAVACGWCRVTLVLLGSNEEKLIHDKKNEDQEELRTKGDDLNEPLLMQV